MERVLRLVNVAACCLFLFFLATNGALIPTQFLESKNGSIIYPKSLHLVGMADGKAFFVDNDLYLNWTDAKAYCESINFQMASITSEAQATMLNISYNSSTFFNSYWTAGRDVLDLRQFIWDTEDKQPDNNYLNFRRNQNQNHLTCLFYTSRSENSTLGNVECTYPLRPLCDTGNLGNAN